MNNKELYEELLKLRKREKKYQQNFRNSRYGITQREYEELLMLQHGVCAICEQPMRRPCIDHHHKSNKVRGILCYRCNIKMAAVDDAKWLHAAMLYMIHHEQTTGQ